MFIRYWQQASTYWSSLCCGEVKGFLYGWSLWNHLQFLEISGDMKNAFSTEKKRSLLNKAGLNVKDCQHYSN